MKLQMHISEKPIVKNFFLSKRSLVQPDIQPKITLGGLPSTYL